MLDRKGDNKNKNNSDFKTRSQFQGIIKKNVQVIY